MVLKAFLMSRKNTTNWLFFSRCCRQTGRAGGPPVADQRRQKRGEAVNLNTVTTRGDEPARRANLDFHLDFPGYVLVSDGTRRFDHNSTSCSVPAQPIRK